MTLPTGEVVVCDAGPLIVLARVDELGLRRKLFEDVFVPPAVWTEATRKATAPGASVVLASSWIQLRAPHSVPTSKLGLGEREAMGLAAELAAILIVDDAAARTEAVAMAHVSHRVATSVGFL
jgi:predicted nucleic acid-binding protein